MQRIPITTINRGNRAITNKSNYNNKQTIANTKIESNAHKINAIYVILIEEVNIDRYDHKRYMQTGFFLLLL